MNILGSGEKEFGVAEITKAGTYEYEITEVNTKAANYTYDTTVIMPYIVIGAAAIALLLMLLFKRRKAN